MSALSRSGWAGDGSPAQGKSEPSRHLPLRMLVLEELGRREAWGRGEPSTPSASSWHALGLGTLGPL